MQSLLIILFCILSAICYGILHDQVTAHLCVEYFTIGHPPVFHTDDPTLLAFGWGIRATWWVGLFLGIPLAVAAQFGSRPKRSAASLIRPVLQLVAVMGISAMTAGITGYFLARLGVVYLVGPLAQEVPVARHPVFLADLWAHSSSYFMGFIGGFAVMVRVWLSRRSQ